MAKIAAWRDGDIFTRERITLYSLPPILFYLALAAGYLAAVRQGGEGLFGGDFLGFWSASWMELHRPYAALYDNDALIAVQAMIVPAGGGYFCWLYPPTAGLLVLPLALMPYGVSFFLWIGVQLAAALAVLRRIVGHRQALPAAFAFAPLAVNLFVGQNGLFSAAVLGGGLLLLPGRPLLAGLLLSALCIKPHLGLLIPVALIAARQWWGLTGGLLGGLLFGGASLLLAGLDGWAAFIAHGGYARAVLESGAVSWGKMASVYATLRSFGAPNGTAWAGQGLVLLATAGLVARVWSSDCRYALKAAMLAAAVPLATPFVLTYDLLPLGLAVAWIAADGLERGFLPWEQTLCAAVWIAPAVTLGLGLTTGVSLAPLAGMALVWLIRRRVRRGDAARWRPRSGLPA